MKKLRVAVLISGRGSNMLALTDACSAKNSPAEITLVISDKSDASGLDCARKKSIAAKALEFEKYENKAAFEDALQSILESHSIDFICLAGFMRLLSQKFTDTWRNKLINIHPSLLPSFKGLDTHQRTIDAGVRIAGCTVHFVRFKMDDGPIIIQSAVPVFPHDTAESLAERILKEEHKIYPKALMMIATGAVTISGDKIIYWDSFKSGTCLTCPKA